MGPSVVVGFVLAQGMTEREAIQEGILLAGSSTTTASPPPSRGWWRKREKAASSSAKNKGRSNDVPVVMHGDLVDRLERKLATERGGGGSGGGSGGGGGVGRPLATRASTRQVRQTDHTSASDDDDDEIVDSDNADMGDNADIGDYDDGDYGDGDSESSPDSGHPLRPRSSIEMAPPLRRPSLRDGGDDEGDAGSGVGDGADDDDSGGGAERRRGPNEDLSTSPVASPHQHNRSRARGDGGLFSYFGNGLFGRYSRHLNEDELNEVGAELEEVKEEKEEVKERRDGGSLHGVAPPSTAAKKSLKEFTQRPFVSVDGGNGGEKRGEVLELSPSVRSPIAAGVPPPLPPRLQPPIAAVSTPITSVANTAGATEGGVFSMPETTWHAPRQQLRGTVVDMDDLAALAGEL